MISSASTLSFFVELTADFRLSKKAVGALLLALEFIGPAASFSVGQIRSAQWELPIGNGHSYELFVVPTGLTWLEAKLAAETSGGYLATITTSAENDFVFNLVKDVPNAWFLDSFGDTMGPWLGGRQRVNSREPDGGWEWVSGEAWTYTNWAYGGPNNSYGGGAEDSLLFLGRGSERGREWNDFPGLRKAYAYVVERNTAVTSPPAISAQPSGQSLLTGQPLQLSVSASGSSPLSYQWLKSGAVIAGATASSYSVASVNTSDAGAYSVVVSNAFGAVYSSSATVTVTQPVAPVITTQPRSVSATSGSTVSFTVEASGTPSPSYQWLKDGAPVAGATTRTLIYLAVSSANAGTYSVAASNSQGTVVSTGATLTVTAPVSAPVLTSQPASQTASAGSSVVLTAGAVGSPQPAYQWLKNGSVIVGATNAALILPSVSSSDAGNYYVIATNSAGAATSTAATLAVTPASALSNLSVRTTLSSGQTLIVGGVVSGGSKPILVRAAGPALNKFGLVGMADPRLELYAGQVPVGSNDNWQSTLAATFSRVGAFAFDVGSLDAAFSQSLNGAFTVQAKGTGPGALLVEAYDTGGGVAPRMVNISARNFVGTGADILIAGFALSGSGTKQLLIRAVGPTLAAFGVSNALADPKLTVLTGAGLIITENDNWEPTLATTFSQVGAFPLSLGSRDAALLVTLTAGASFTVQVSGVNGTTGEALIEIYEVF